MPDTYLGPFDALNPRTLWKFTLLVMTISAGGHVALRLFGPRIGLPLAGFASGFISSTLTVGTMGQRVAAEPLLMGPAVAGAVLSSVSTLVLMATVLAAISPAAQALALPLACSGRPRWPMPCCCCSRRCGEDDRADPGRTALHLQAALTLALVAAAALIAAAALDAWLGPRGITVAAVLGGLVDARRRRRWPRWRRRTGSTRRRWPVLAALSANAASKAVYAVVSGGRYAVQVIPGLLLMIAAAWAATRRFERDGRRRPRRLGGLGQEAGGAFGDFRHPFLPGFWPLIRAARPSWICRGSFFQVAEIGQFAFHQVRHELLLRPAGPSSSRPRRYRRRPGRRPAFPCRS